MWGNQIPWVSPFSLRGKLKKERFTYWCEFLYLRLTSVFEWNIPDDWDIDYLNYHIFARGFLPVVDTELGVLALEGTLDGRNPYGKPSMVRVINEGLDWSIDVHEKIGEGAVVLAPFTNYFPSFIPIIQEYAYTLALMSSSLNVSVLNSRMAFFIATKDKASAKTIQDMLDRVYNGEPAVVYDKLLGNPDRSDEPIVFQQMNAQNAYLADRILADIETVIRHFDGIIGLPTVNNKRERMLSSEIDTQNSGNTSIARQALRNLRKQVGDINRLFGTNISIKLTFKEDGDTNGTGEDEGGDN